MTDLNDQEFESELRIHEALDVASTTPIFSFYTLIAYSVIITQIGFANLTPPAIAAVTILLIMNLMGLKSYYKLRNKPRPISISPRRLRVFLITSLILGTSWGSFNFFMFPTLEPHEQMLLYLFTFIGGFGAATTVSLRVSWGFSGPIMGLTWLAMLLWGSLDWYINTVTVLGSVFAITQLTLLTRKSAIKGIRLTLANTKALDDQLKAENQMRELARIPEENPNPVLRVTEQGELTYANKASAPLIEALQLRVGDRVGTGWRKRVAKGLSGDQRQDFEYEAGGQIYTLLLWPVPEGGYANIYGRDITTQKHAERELRVAKNSAEAAKEEAEKTLADLKKTQNSLIHAEKMASLGQLTAGIAHEIKNPLNFVNNFSKLSAEMMDELMAVLKAPIATLEEEDREDAQDLMQTVTENLTKIEEHGRRADSIVKNMLMHSHEGGAEKQLIDLNALVLEAVNLAYHGARAANKSFNVDLQTDLSDDVGQIECLPQELQRVVLNICSNGMYEAAKYARASDREPQLKVATRVNSGRYEVLISDNGGGIPNDMREKIFDPFFTTKPTGEGTGLGLSMSFDIIKQHGGLLTFDSEVGVGTTFCFELPAPGGDDLC
ncbi:sensor histidine kinase [Ruegeria halocynthiae]|uniref:sensor histidine kinase n=1 Tax=Ruegeria halocynthiae TaxID=985054 RepID=UPI000689FC08|nr:ATP-binding protein [Ruegeria halocynthiae]